MKTKSSNKRMTPLTDFSLKLGGFAVREKNLQADYFDSINAYYESTKKIDLNPPNTAFSCTALKLARFMMKYFGEKKYPLTEEISLPDSFYIKCANSLKKYDILNANDNIMLITLKQMMHLLRFAEIVKIENGLTFLAKAEISDQALYFKILNAFWNGVSWPDIFPSAPEAAIDLHEDKMILMDILRHYNAKAEITALCNDFFELTGFARRNDIRAISFIDFYLFFWLKNFRIINYYNVGNRISLNLTSMGKKLLAFINN